jgi:short-subunit dehydrogenase
VVVITGASRGLGVEMARRFAREGAKLALAARSGSELEKVRAELEAQGATAIAAPTDVGDLASLRALVKEVTSSLGPIDVLVNNAGLEEPIDFELASLESIEEITSVNVLGVLWLTRLVVPGMIERRSGHIVNIASIAGLTPVPHNTVYCTTKHAVVGFTRALRLELAEHGIGVSVVCPGTVDGGMYLKWTAKAPAAVGRMVTMQEVAEGVVQSVLRNKGEVLVSKGLTKLGDVTFALAPELAGKIMGRTGVLDYLSAQAKANAERGTKG